jgi:integrase
VAKRLTDRTIVQLKAGKSRLEFPDGGCHGLYLVIHPSGAKAWALRFRSPIERDADGARKAKKLTLGTLANEATDDEPQIGRPLSLSQARVLATGALEQVRRGVDPTHERRAEKAASRDEAISRSINTVDAAMIEFLKRYRGKKKQGLRDSTRLLTAHYFGLKLDPDKPGEWKKSGNGVLGHWSGKPLASITKGDAIVLLDKLVDAGHGVTANRTLTNLKTFFGWCVKRDMLAVSPVAALDAVAEEHSRERTLSDAELVALWKAADAEGYPFGKLMQLLLLTGARRDELRDMPRSEFELTASIKLGNGNIWQGPIWTLPAARAKNNREHLVPLSPLTVEILESLPRIGKSALLFTTTGDTPISGLSKAKARLDEAMRAELRKSDPKHVWKDWTPHDLRRTFYSGLQGLGFSIEIAEACVNHTLGGVAGVYGRHKYLTEKTAAFAAWARHVDGLVNGRPAANANVVAFR